MANVRIAKLRDNYKNKVPFVSTEGTLFLLKII